MAIKIKFLPARYGDSIWIEYEHNNETFRILIDGGTQGTRKDIEKLISALPEDQRVLELLVITHIDRDHIEGILELLNKEKLDFRVKELWFNGWCHLPENPVDEIFGAVQGEKLSQRILELDLPWNAKFDGKAVSIPAQSSLPQFELAGGMKISLLSPYEDNLSSLKSKWEEEVRNANLDPGFGLDVDDEDIDDYIETFDGQELPDVDLLAASEFDEDESPANGSSIAFLAEFEGWKGLFAGDGYPSVIVKSLEQYSPGDKVDLDLIKLAHHGSDHNLSKELLDKIHCSKFIFSTNGSIYYHPSQNTVSRVIKWGGEKPELIFNYKSEENIIWDLPYLCDKYDYTSVYPEDNKHGIELNFD